MREKTTGLPAGTPKQTKNGEAHKSVPDFRKRRSQDRSRTRGGDNNFAFTTYFIRQIDQRQSRHGCVLGAVPIATNTQQGSRLLFFFGIEDNLADDKQKKSGGKS